jgi:hypothetical protein
LLTAIDGTMLTIADSGDNRGRYVKQRGNHGGSGYPTLRLSALLSCGTRSVLDAVFDPITTGELDQARRLRRSLRPGMLLLADRNYAAADLISALAKHQVTLRVTIYAEAVGALTDKIHSLRNGESPKTVDGDETAVVEDAAITTARSLVVGAPGGSRATRECAATSRNATFVVVGGAWPLPPRGFGRSDRPRWCSGRLNAHSRGHPLGVRLPVRDPKDPGSPRRPSRPDGEVALTGTPEGAAGFRGGRRGRDR